MDLPSNAELEEISKLAKNQIWAQKVVDDLTNQLKTATENLRQVQEVDLPNAMAQAGVSEIKLPTGEKITIKEDIYASIPKDERYPEAINWLKKHGFGDVIKNEIKVAFGKGQDEEAIKLMNLLAQHNWRQDAQQAISVHPATLKSLIKEQLANGKEIPMDLFGAYPTTKAVIK